MREPLVGVLGGGQLGLMLAQAATNLGIRVRALDAAPDVPASRACDVVVGRFDDERAIERLASGCDVVTCEFENVAASSLEMASRFAPVHPLPRAFAIAQDRALERGLFTSLGIATPRWAAVDRAEGAAGALREVGLPAILKTRRMGYDGKGQRLVRSVEEGEAAARELLAHATGGLIADEVIAFEREVSILAARSLAGEVRVYPLTENIHKRGILWRSIAPAPGGSGELGASAEAAARRVIESLGYVGVLALEFFVARTAHGETLLANEMAPRVHNSGHWTIEGAATSQFENHLRAILGLPLGEASITARPGGSPGASDGPVVAMLNLVGSIPSLESILRVPGAHVHLYGKAPRPGRKVGHVTVVESDLERLSPRLNALESLIAWDV